MYVYIKILENGWLMLGTELDWTCLNCHLCIQSILSKHRGYVPEKLCSVYLRIHERNGSQGT